MTAKQSRQVPGTEVLLDLDALGRRGLEALTRLAREVLGSPAGCRALIETMKEQGIRDDSVQATGIAEVAAEMGLDRLTQDEFILLFSDVRAVETLAARLHPDLPAGDKEAGSGRWQAVDNSLAALTFFFQKTTSGPGERTAGAGLERALQETMGSTKSPSERLSALADVAEEAVRMRLWASGRGALKGIPIPAYDAPFKAAGCKGALADQDAAELARIIEERVPRVLRALSSW